MRRVVIAIMAMAGIALNTVAAPILGLVDVATGQEIPDADLRYVLAGSGLTTNDSPTMAFGTEWVFSFARVTNNASSGEDIVNYQTMTNYVATHGGSASNWSSYLATSTVRTDGNDIDLDTGHIVDGSADLYTLVVDSVINDGDPISIGDLMNMTSATVSSTATGGIDVVNYQTMTNYVASHGSTSPWVESFGTYTLSPTNIVGPNCVVSNPAAMNANATVFRVKRGGTTLFDIDEDGDITRPTSANISATSGNGSFRVDTDKCIILAGGNEMANWGFTVGYLFNQYNLSAFDFQIGTVSGDKAFFVDAGTADVVINDDGVSTTDFRVEGDTDSTLIFAQAATDRVGIGTNVPATKLEVIGDIRSTVDSTNSCTLEWYDSSNRWAVVSRIGATTNVTYMSGYPAGTTWKTNIADVVLENGTSCDFAVENFSNQFPEWGGLWAFLTATGGHPIAVNTQWKFYKGDSRIDSIRFLSATNVVLTELALSANSSSGTNVVYVADTTDFEENSYINIHNGTMTTNETHLIVSLGETNLVLSGTLTHSWTTAGFASKILDFDMPVFPIASSNSLLGTVEYTDPSTNQFGLRFIAEYK